MSAAPAKAMIIFVGGLVGAGKSTIAKGLARELACPYYDVDEVKKAVFREDPDYERNLREGIPFSDATRAKVYERVIADLQAQRSAHETIVVDEVLHRRELRHKLYRAAEEIFGAFLVIWVRADEKVVLARLNAARREGHLLADPIPMHEAFRKQFEDFNRSVIVCNNNGEPEESLSYLKDLIANVATLAGSG